MGVIKIVMSWPGRIKPGVFDQPVIQMDLHRTALAAADYAAKTDWKFDGVNLLPFLSGENTGAPHDALYWRFGAQMAIRMGDWKLVRYDNHVDLGTSGVSAPKLYNLATDLGETKDLAATEPARVQELQAKWDEWNATPAKPLWGGDHTGGPATAPDRPRGQRRNPR